MCLDGISNVGDLKTMALVNAPANSCCNLGTMSPMSRSSRHWRTWAPVTIFWLDPVARSLALYICIEIGRVHKFVSQKHDEAN